MRVGVCTCVWEVEELLAHVSASEYPAGAGEGGGGGFFHFRLLRLLLLAHDLLLMLHLAANHKHSQRQKYIATERVFYGGHLESDTGRHGSEASRINTLCRGLASLTRDNNFRFNMNIKSQTWRN